MSRKKKLLERLRKIPSPKDFTWDELVTLMRQFEFNETCKSGSHYMFEHSSGYKFGMSKTHPSGILKKYQITEALNAIDHVSKNK